MSTAEHTHDDHHGHDFASHVRPYILVFAALIIGTILTVAVSYVHFDALLFGNHEGHTVNMIIGLLIATVKATLVILFFMHLISEKTLIYLILGFTTFFVIGLAGLTIWAMHDYPSLTELFLGGWLKH